VILPDANLLLYAHNLASPFHAKSAAWWSRCLSEHEPVVLCGPVLFGFLRIATSRYAYAHPLTFERASMLMTQWMDQPVVQFAELNRPDIDLALTLLGEVGAAGNLTTDAQIAVIALRLGAVVHTADSDFSRFHGVRWFNPLTAERRK
jgi:toxin-antitoxin system PIN domain toxin